MKGKLLENIVLSIGLLVIAAAVFLMFFAQTPELVKSVNMIFATGFIIYIIYNHIMARNLNGEIYELQKHVANLKEEIGRLEDTLRERNTTIADHEKTIASHEQTIAEAGAKLEDAEKKLIAANEEVKRLTQALTKEEKQ